jgi:beta-glucosidase
MNCEDDSTCKLLFQGFVVSDWEGIDRLCEPRGSDYRYCIAQSVNAGMDMVLVIT